MQIVIAVAWFHLYHGESSEWRSHVTVTTINLSTPENRMTKRTNLCHVLELNNVGVLLLSCGVDTLQRKGHTTRLAAAEVRASTMARQSSLCISKRECKKLCKPHTSEANSCLRELRPGDFSAPRIHLHCGTSLGRRCHQATSPRTSRVMRA